MFQWLSFDKDANLAFRFSLNLEPVVIMAAVVGFIRAISSDHVERFGVCRGFEVAFGIFAGEVRALIVVVSRVEDGFHVVFRAKAVRSCVVGRGIVDVSSIDGIAGPEGRVPLESEKGFLQVISKDLLNSRRNGANLPQSLLLNLQVD